MPEPVRCLRFVKAHAYGNDFLIAQAGAVARGTDVPALARRICDRQRGIGADGLLLVTEQTNGAAMRLWNADGSVAEVSGNGVRCIGAWLALEQALEPGATLSIETAAGAKSLRLLERRHTHARFSTGMGRPTGLERASVEIAGVSIDIVTLGMGNPQCVVLGAATPDRLHSLAGPLATHPRFPDGTNVELVEVAAPDHLRILIWERGVGPTLSSGTGTCAAAVAAAAFGGAARDVDVEAPGGTQHVTWTDEGVELTGWATIVAEGEWRDGGEMGN